VDARLDGNHLEGGDVEAERIQRQRPITCTLADGVRWRTAERFLGLA